jgi:spermidine/putrescine transport system ATP-binding protein
VDLTLTAHGMRFAAPATRARVSEGRVWLGVRPEKVRLALPDEGAPATHNQVVGVLTDTCYAGVSTEYLLKTPWGQEMSVFSANASAGEPLSPGTEVVAHWYPPHSFVLDRPDGAGDEISQYSADPLGVAP